MKVFKRVSYVDSRRNFIKGDLAAFQRMTAKSFELRLSMDITIDENMGCLMAYRVLEQDSKYYDCKPPEYRKDRNDKITTLQGENGLEVLSLSSPELIRTSAYLRGSNAFADLNITVDPFAGTKATKMDENGDIGLMVRFSEFVKLVASLWRNSVVYTIPCASDAYIEEVKHRVEGFPWEEAVPKRCLQHVTLNIISNDK